MKKKLSWIFCLLLAFCTSSSFANCIFKELIVSDNNSGKNFLMAPHVSFDVVVEPYTLRLTFSKQTFGSGYEKDSLVRRLEFAYLNGNKINLILSDGLCDQTGKFRPYNQRHKMLTQVFPNSIEDVQIIR